MYTAGVLAAAIFLLFAPPEAPDAASTDLAEEPAEPEVAAPEVQRPAGASAPAPVRAPAPVSAPASAPVRRTYVQRPKPGEGDVVAPAGPQPANDGMARYYRAPFGETVWPKVVGRDVLLVLGAGTRTCVTLTRKTADALHFTSRKTGSAQQAPLAAVTSIHENSWECDKDYDSTPSEWARSGAIGGLTMSAIGGVMGIINDVLPRTCTTDESGVLQCTNKMVPTAYSVIGVTMTTLGTPIIAAGGYSTSRDLRVQGKIWARATGWVMYGSGTLLNVLWLIGTYGKIDALDGRGMTTAAGLLGVGGSAFMAYDALSARNELAALRLQDATPASPGRTSRLQFGARPLGGVGQMHGLAFGVGGRF